jgi:exopolyphosphatase/guanosine-5'-triphosphate,3'-diphosphate pyrophosphatase
VFDQVLRATIPGQTHPERAFLALAAFRRYGGERPDNPTVTRILSPERIERAEALGAAIRLAAQLSGRSPELLAASSVGIAKNDLTLSVSRATADLLLGEQTSKRAQALASILKADLKVKVR